LGQKLIEKFVINILNTITSDEGIKAAVEHYRELHKVPNIPEPRQSFVVDRFKQRMDAPRVMTEMNVPTQLAEFAREKPEPPPTRKLRGL
jgi:hypothetical protein